MSRITIAIGDMNNPTAMLITEHNDLARDFLAAHAPIPAPVLLSDWAGVPAPAVRVVLPEVGAKRLTEDELNVLPVGSKVKDTSSDLWTKNADGTWTCALGGSYYADWTGASLVGTYPSGDGIVLVAVGA